MFPPDWHLWAEFCGTLWPTSPPKSPSHYVAKQHLAIGSCRVAPVCARIYKRTPVVVHHLGLHSAVTETGNLMRILMGFWWDSNGCHQMVDVLRELIRPSAWNDPFRMFKPQNGSRPCLHGKEATMQSAEQCRKSNCRVLASGCSCGAFGCRLALLETRATWSLILPENSN